jgi:predicted nucleic acid-binding protein
MEYIVDASVIIAVIANEPVKEHLIEITRGVDLLAPASVHWEIGNAFSAMIKRGRISLDQALNALEIYRKIPLRLTDVELEKTLSIAEKFSIYAYDAYLLRCAIRYKSPLITLDRKLAKIAQNMNIDVVEIIK